MPKLGERFQWLAERFEEVANHLTRCQDTSHRKELLRKMKIIIDEVDALIAKEEPALNSTQEQNAVE